jgi:hypothetical protein
VASTFAAVDWIGFGDSTAEYQKFDSEIRGIVVDVSEPFTADGTVKRFRFFAGGGDGVSRCASKFDVGEECWVGRLLWFHILERSGEGPCGTFTSIRMKKHIAVDGLNVVEMDTAQEVKAGMFYGFSWSDYGAVSFDFNQATDINYCWGENKAESSGLLEYEQPTVDLSEDTGTDQGVSFRKYAFEVEFEEPDDECPDLEWLGCGDGSGDMLYDKFDTEKTGLYVDISDPFPSAGLVKGFRFVTGGNDGNSRCSADKGPECWVGRDLWLGIFKRTGAGPCGAFEAVRLKKVKGTLDGFNYVELETPEHVEAGMFYGFAFDLYGSISFDFADLVEENLCYCYGNNLGKGSGRLTYQQRHVDLSVVPADISAANAFDEKFRVSYRKYAFNVEFCPDEPVVPDCWLGCGDSVQEYEKFDTEKRGIIVDVSDPFPTDGFVDTFRFFAGGTDGAARCAAPVKFNSDTCWVGRDILLSIFRRVGDGPCGDFKVIRSKKWTVQDGVNVVVMGTPQEVKAGDFFGFSWREYGAVSFDFNDADNELCYCHGDGDDLGSGALTFSTTDVTLSATDIADDYSISYRKYAFEVSYNCDEPEPTPTPPPCDWIGCGERDTLHQEFDTENRGIIVDIKHGVPGPGYLKSFAFTTGASKPNRCSSTFNDSQCWIGRKLKIGVFIRNGEGPCGEFVAGNQKIVVVDDGLNVVDLTNPWKVDFGDFIGFSWISYGAVSYDFTDIMPENECYCWGENMAAKSGVVGESGSVVDLKASSSNPVPGSYDERFRPSYRDYAFEAHFCPEV